MKTYQARSALVPHPLTQRLFQLMTEKKTNLAVAADITSKAALLDLANDIGPEICILKTHIDILEDFDPDLPHQLKQLAREHNFLLFEDRKFADIGNTVQLQYRSGIYRIADWADMITVHTLPGPGVIQGLKPQTGASACGLLLLAEMSSQGNLLDDHYKQATLQMARQNKDCVMGFISQHKLCDDTDFIYMTPGIGLNKTSDQLAQNYIDPEQAILVNGTDVIIVGRSIYQTPSPRFVAQEYRELGWQAYLKRCDE